MWFHSKSYHSKPIILFVLWLEFVNVEVWVCESELVSLRSLSLVSIDYLLKEFGQYIYSNMPLKMASKFYMRDSLDHLVMNYVTPFKLGLWALKLCKFKFSHIYYHIMSKLLHPTFYSFFKSGIFTALEMCINIGHTIYEICRLFITYDFSGPQWSCIPTQHNVTIPMVWPTLVDCYIAKCSLLQKILNLVNHVLNRPY